jgi:hypothetical protein
VKTKEKKAGMGQEKGQANRPIKTPEHPRCRGVTRRGEQCRFTPIGGTEFCLWHSPDPAIQARARLAAHKGAIAAAPRHLPEDHPAAKVGSVEDALVLTEETIQGVRTGTLSPNVANSVFYGLSVAGKFLELQVLDQLEALEAAIGVKLTRREPA